MRVGTQRTRRQRRGASRTRARLRSRSGSRARAERPACRRATVARPRRSMSRPSAYRSRSPKSSKSAGAPSASTSTDDRRRLFCVRASLASRSSTGTQPASVPRGVTCLPGHDQPSPQGCRPPAKGAATPAAMMPPAFGGRRDRHRMGVPPRRVRGGSGGRRKRRQSPRRSRACSTRATRLRPPDHGSERRVRVSSQSVVTAPPAFPGQRRACAARTPPSGSGRYSSGASRSPTRRRRRSARTCAPRLVARRGASAEGLRSCRAQNAEPL